MMQQEITITIERIAYGGAGIGRLPDGRVCFVHGTLPGERALVRVVKSKKNLAEADLVRLLEISPRRVAPACPVFGECGGCAYQHADYELQLEIKTSQVADLLRRVGGLQNATVNPMLPSPEQLGYRNRLSVHTDRGDVGFYHRKSHHLVDVATCPIASAEVNRQLAELRKNPSHQSGRITLREERSPRGFTQVNSGAAALLADTVCKMAGEGEYLIDAYCGSGFFAKKLLPHFHRIHGIEWSEAAVRSARETATQNETYVAGSVEAHLSEALAACDSLQTTLLLDPPSEGLSPDAMRAILENPPARIVYVSCDPATFARDAKRFSDHYNIGSVQPVDMFPQTAEIELAAVFERKTRVENIP
ncbi:MAG: class I SAM-dependent RNA methyltransferase [bacterium]